MFAIANFANKRYVFGQNRLRDSVPKNFTGELLFYNNWCDIPCKPHEELAYGFKAAIIEKAIARGIRYILWLDSSFYIRKDLDLIFDKIKTDGYILFNQGYSVGDITLGEWSSDAALRVFGISREEAYKMPSCIGGFFGLDLHRNADFLHEYLALSKNPEVMNGSWNNLDNAVSIDSKVNGHRHDQTLLSFLSWKHGMRNYICGEERFTFYSGYYDDYKNPNSAVVFTQL
jgi:hypothetical protein